jgi:dihydrofolate reductase
MKKISFIVAVAQNNVIGKDNQLLWHLPDDMKWFKQTTLGCDVIMGRKTYNSLQVKPLPKRKNIVITRSNEQIEGCIMASSIEDAIQKMDPEKENFVIGGGTVYEQFMPYVQKLYITKVFKEFEGDTFFSEIDPSKWKLTFSEKHPMDEKHPMEFEFQIFELK